MIPRPNKASRPVIEGEPTTMGRQLLDSFMWNKMVEMAEKLCVNYVNHLEEKGVLYAKELKNIRDAKALIHQDCKIGGNFSLDVLLSGTLTQTKAIIMHTKMDEMQFL